MKKLLAFILILVACPAWAATQWYQGDGTAPLVGTTLINDIDTASQNYAFDPLNRLLDGYRKGQAIIYASASTLTVSAGEIVVSDGVISKLMLRNASDTTVTWADIDTGTEELSKQYYVYAIGATSAATAVTYKISLSSTAPTGVTFYKRLGSFYNDASGNITSITNDNNYYAPSVGASVAKTSGVDYLALTDGVLTASCFNNGGVLSYIYTDSATSPTTAVTKCGVDASSNTDCSMSFLIKRSNYYRAVCGTSTDYIFFTPLSN